MALSQHRLMLTLDAKMSSRAKKAFLSMNQRLKVMGHKAATSEKLADTTGKYGAARERLQKQAVAWREAQKALAKYNRETIKGKKPTADQEKRQAKLQKTLDNSRRKLLNTAKATNKLGKALKSAGVNTKRYVSEQKRLAAQAKATTRAMGPQHRMMRMRERAAQRRGDARNTLFYGMVGVYATARMFKIGMDFEEKMAAVRAKTPGITGEQFEMLEKRARDLGRTTTYTASQVAGAMLSLSKSGMKPIETFNAIGSVLNMARAELMGIEDASAIAVRTLRAFQIEASNMAVVADAMTYVASTTMATVTEMGVTFSYAAPLARQLGMEVEDLAAMTGFLADVGISGSKAGTALRRMLVSLVSPTARAQNKMKELVEMMGLADMEDELNKTRDVFTDAGVAITDAAGKFRNPIAILGDLKTAMDASGKSSHQFIKTLNSIFGVRALPSATRLVSEAKALDKYRVGMEEMTGTALRMRKEMDDTASGGVKILTSALHEMFITLTGPKNVQLKEMSMNLAEQINALSVGMTEHPTAANAALMTGVAGGSAVMAGAMGRFIYWSVAPVIAWATSAAGLAALTPIAALLAAGAVAYGVADVAEKSRGILSAEEVSKRKMIYDELGKREYKSKLLRIDDMYREYAERYAKTTWMSAGMIEFMLRGEQKRVEAEYRKGVGETEYAKQRALFMEHRFKAEMIKMDRTAEAIKSGQAWDYTKTGGDASMLGYAYPFMEAAIPFMPGSRSFMPGYKHGFDADTAKWAKGNTRGNMPLAVYVTTHITGTNDPEEIKKKMGEVFDEKLVPALEKNQRNALENAFY